MYCDVKVFNEMGSFNTEYQHMSAQDVESARCLGSTVFSIVSQFVFMILSPLSVVAYLLGYICFIYCMVDKLLNFDYYKTGSMLSGHNEYTDQL